MKPKALAFTVILLLLMMSQFACTLTLETVHYRYVYNRYQCRTVLMDTSTGERRSVNSSMLSTDAPGASSRSFLNYDWNNNGESNVSDAELDWRRYLRNDIVNSSSFMGRSWCARLSETSCTMSDRQSSSTRLPFPALPEAELPNCFETEGPQLEVTAPGLSSDSRLAFPDTAVGTTGSSPILFTVTNRSTLALRVNAIDFMAGGDIPDFVKSSDSCAPTSAEMIAGRGHLLGAGAACTFQMQFLPQHRDGVFECAPGSPTDSCRRSAALYVTGETDMTRNIVTPVRVNVSGRALGGSLSVPSEVCFPTAPAVGDCTPYQTFTIRNTTSGDLTLTSARLTRAGNRWEATMPFLMPLTLRMGLSIDVPVRFCNVANDPTDGEFTINSSSPTNPTTVVTLVNPLNRRCP